MKTNALAFVLVFAAFSMAVAAYPSNGDEAMSLVYGCQSSEGCYGSAIQCTQTCSGPTDVCTRQCADSMIACIKGCLIRQGIPAECASILTGLTRDQPYIDCVLRNMPTQGTPISGATRTPSPQATATQSHQTECFEQSDCPEGQSCAGGVCQGGESGCSSGLILAFLAGATLLFAFWKR